MLEKLIHELSVFAKDNNLLFKYNFDEETAYHRFVFQDLEQTWGHCQELSQEHINSFSDSVCAYDVVVNRLKTKIMKYVKETQL